jgi:membrane protein
MEERVERVLTLLRALVHEVRTEKVTFLAGSIAYHAFVSMLPLLLLLLAVLSRVGDRTLTDAVLELARAVLTPGASDLLLNELQQGATSTGVSLFGLAVLLWGTLRIFRGLDTAFSDIYETESENTLGDQLLDGVVVLFTFGLAVTVAGLVLDAIPEGGGAVGLAVRTAALVAALSLVLLPMYYVFPDTDVSLVEVLPGTLFAAGGLTAFKTLFAFYIQYSSRQPRQSVIAGVLVLLTWLYFSGLVLLLGVAINAVLSNRSADVNVAPVFGGKDRLEEHERPDRETVSTALDELESLLDPPQRLRVSVGERSLSLPAPQHVRVDTADSAFSVSDTHVALELRWSPTDADRAGLAPPGPPGVDGGEGEEGEESGNGDTERTANEGNDGDAADDSGAAGGDTDRD